jgi:hypothetical protein
MVGSIDGFDYIQHIYILEECKWASSGKERDTNVEKGVTLNANTKSSLAPFSTSFMLINQSLLVGAQQSSNSLGPRTLIGPLHRLDTK